MLILCYILDTALSVFVNFTKENISYKVILYLYTNII